MRAGDPYRSPRSHLKREITTGDDYGYCEDAMILAGTSEGDHDRRSLQGRCNDLSPGDSGDHYTRPIYIRARVVIFSCIVISLAGLFFVMPISKTIPGFRRIFLRENAALDNYPPSLALKGRRNPEWKHSRKTSGPASFLQSNAKGALSAHRIPAWKEREAIL